MQKSLSPFPKIVVDREPSRKNVEEKLDTDCESLLQKQRYFLGYYQASWL
ncbi:hypothetical protein MSP8887_00749 [Marinomonas spartinae]|uniref:Uncharacterized protein n=1 Tax=Marinomonas spartinae TaxID=1792290 RepID=A0A1A8T999_9GAMM|nr:hypothetical protein MSP8887_00749 [Marinomonas spartinae]SBS28544.1 hypothetical protein MSP8886_01218 [Marinomonas spartinae]